MTYQPSTIQGGGARLSTSMLSTWARCRAEWFFTYLAPHPEVEGSAGFVTSTNTAATLGTAVHKGLEVYRISGLRDGVDVGEYDLDPAIATMRSVLEEAAESLDYPMEAEELIVTGERLLRAYHVERPGHPQLDWRLLTHPETGEPLVEHEYAIPVLGGRFLYTVKTDALVQFTSPTYCVKAIDYKTKSYRFMGDFERATPLMGQGWGEVAVLHTFFPSLPITGMQYELLIKDRGQRSHLPTINVCPVPVTPKQAHRWLRNVEKWATEIAWAVADWHSQVEKGRDPYQAGMDVFTTTGQLQESNTCARYGRTCDFARVCEDFDERGARAVLMGLEARATIEEER